MHAAELTGVIIDVLLVSDWSCLCKLDANNISESLRPQNMDSIVDYM